MDSVFSNLSIDVVTSARNEAQNLKELHSRVDATLRGIKVENWRLIISDNASTDSTWGVIRELSEHNPEVIGIRLSRDFGYEGSITAALSESKNDVVIVMASDLQDSPERIPEMLKLFVAGNDHVYQVVQNRPDSGFIRRLNSRIFYSLASKFSNGLISQNSSTFRILSGGMRDTLLAMPERNRYLRAMVNWVGFKSIGIEFDREMRYLGKSKANTREVVNYAIKLTLANSYYLLNLLGVLGVASSLFSMFLFVAFLIIWLTKGVPFAGFGLLVSIVLLGFGMLLLFLGLISQYVSLMYEELKMRPNFVVAEKIGYFDDVNK